MGQTAAARARQAELDGYASSRGWERGPFRSWTKKGYTIARSARGGYVITRRSTADRREVRSLEDLDRVIQWALASGRFPAESVGSAP